MSKSSLSIALCTYQGARYIQEQLDSIASQIRLPDEVVLCDDGSTDETLTVAKRFADSAPFPVKIHRNGATLGVTGNFERAIRMCHGDIIVLSDQDDVWLPNKLFKLESAFDTSPDVGLFFSNATIVDDNLNTLGYTLWDGINFSRAEQCMVQAGDAFRVLLRHNVVTGATAAFRRDCLDLVLPIPRWDIHDSWIALLIAATGKIGLIEDCLIQYRQHEANQIGARKRGVLTRLRRSREAALKDMQRVLQEAGAAAARLQERDTVGRTHDIFTKLITKRCHVEARLRFVNHDDGGLSAFLRELLGRRYHRYSVGWWSVAHDALKWLPRRTVAKQE